jgi:hypothetical protein
VIKDVVDVVAVDGHVIGHVYAHCAHARLNYLHIYCATARRKTLAREKDVGEQVASIGVALAYSIEDFLQLATADLVTGERGEPLLQLCRLKYRAAFYIEAARGKPYYGLG